MDSCIEDSSYLYVVVVLTKMVSDLYYELVTFLVGCNHEVYDREGVIDADLIINLQVTLKVDWLEAESSEETISFRVETN